ncbi:hypothetical protein [Ferrovibrio sp.]|uniref:hypothetical protein n=1 Tax=Ferrovibrio sp. TaxID=1917215 RepID=UPI0035191580
MSVETRTAVPGAQFSGPEFPGSGPAAAAPKPRRKSPVRIDWAAAARLWAAGGRPAAIAGRLGIPEDRLWRHLRRSARFRRQLAEQMERLRLQAAIEYAAAGRDAALEGCRQAGAEPWQAQAAGLAGPAPAGELVEGLRRAAGGRAVRRQMGAELPAAAPARVAARAPAPEPAPESAPARPGAALPGLALPVRTTCIGLTRPRPARRDQGTPEGDGAPRTTANPDEPSRTVTNRDEPSRTEANRDEPPRTGANLAGQADDDDPPMPPSLASIFRSITDLPAAPPAGSG